MVQTTTHPKVSNILPRFEYLEAKMKDVQVKGSYDQHGKFQVSNVLVKDVEATPTGRFWDSLCSRFGFGPSIYRYFTHAEVYNRVSTTLESLKKNGGDRIRIALEKRTGKEKPLLLAVSSPTKNIVYDDMIKSALAKTHPTSITYNEGMVLSHHPLKHDMEFNLNGDKHKTSVLLETPIDGYGNPAIYLEMIRLVCQNGAIARSKSFRSGIIIGKDPSYIIQRALESYNNEDGFTAFKERLLMAQKSQASASEAFRLAQVINSLEIKDPQHYYGAKSAFRSKFIQSLPEKEREEPKNRLLKKLRDKTGDLRAMYGVAQLGSIGEKKLRTLPTKCRVYDLLNFASELTTHQLQPIAANKMSSFIGDMISHEYDLENSSQEFSTFEDFIDAASKPMMNEPRYLEVN